MSNIIDNIILLVGCICEFFILFIYFSNFFEIKEWLINKKMVLTFIIILAIAILFTENSLANGDINLFFFPLITFSCILIIFKGNRSTLLLYYIMAYFLMLFSEWIFAFFFHRNNDYTNVHQFPLEFFAIKLLTYILVLTLQFFLRKPTNKYESITFPCFICIPIASFILMMGIFYSTLNIKIDTNSKLFLTIGFSLLLIGNISSFYAFSQYTAKLVENSEKELTIVRQNADLNYYKQFITLDNNYETFVHDISHTLRVIYQFAQSSETSQISKIIEDTFTDLHKIRTTSFSDNRLLNAIITEKSNQALSHSINFTVNIEPNINLQHINDIDLISMLGNLLDNSIDAAKLGNDQKYVNLNIYTQNSNNICAIKVENNYTGKIIKKDGKILSAKRNYSSTGLGLYSINKSAEKYGGYLSCFYTENVFTAILLLPLECKETVAKII